MPYSHSAVDWSEFHVWCYVQKRDTSVKSKKALKTTSQTANTLTKISPSLDHKSLGVAVYSPLLPARIKTNEVTLSADCSRSYFTSYPASSKSTVGDMTPERAASCTAHMAYSQFAAGAIGEIS